MGVNLKISGLKELARSFGNAPRRANSLFKRVLSFNGLKIKSEAQDILKRTTKTKGEEIRLWKTLSSTTKGSGKKSVLTISWGKLYGHVLEYGPEKKQWKIQARFAKALAFPILDFKGNTKKMIFVPKGKYVIHRWDESQLRPHVIPAFEKNEEQLKKDLIMAAAKAVE